MVAGVIFDMDGLLADSEQLAMRVCVLAGTELGYPITWEIALGTLGCTRQYCDNRYAALFPGYDAEAYHRTFTRLFNRLLETEGVPLKPGADILLDALHARGIPAAVASSSSMERIRMTLEPHGILGYFKILLSGEQLTHSKPAPDIFLTAAAALGVKPQHCLVLEDSKNGLLAGRAAGMQTCMIPDLLPYTEDLASCCDHVLDSLAEVIPLL